MYLPDDLHQRSFVEWNYLVKGLVTIWEMARLLGMEEYLECALRSDRTLVERLARIGNEIPMGISFVPILRVLTTSSFPSLVLGLSPAALSA